MCDPGSMQQHQGKAMLLLHMHEDT
jgi:hypothetical protein